MNKPEIKIFPDIESLSRWTAQRLSESSSQAIAARGRFLIALNGGGTPVRLFQFLASDYRGKLDWNKTHVFWGDERCVPPDDPESSYGQARGLFMEQVKIPDSNIHRINGKLKPVEASKDYALVLKRFAFPPYDWPRFDLVLLGMGEDGHTASLFPGSPVEASAPVLAVTGHYQNRPAERITLTPQVFNSARSVMFMATGENKAVTLSKVLSDVYRPDLYPAQRIKPKNGELIWLVDQAAAKLLSG